MNDKFRPLAYLKDIHDMLAFASKFMRMDTGLGGNCMLQDILDMECHVFTNTIEAVESIQRNLEAPVTYPIWEMSFEAKAEAIRMHLTNGFDYEHLRETRPGKLFQVKHGLKAAINYHYPYFVSTHRTGLKWFCLG